MQKFNECKEALRSSLQKGEATEIGNKKKKAKPLQFFDEYEE